MATNISIKGKAQNGDSNTTTINYVNPAATTEQLVSLATAFNDLTTNTITDITKITKESLTESSKLSRGLFFSSTSNPPGTPITTKTLSSISTNTQEPTNIYIGGTLTGLTVKDINVATELGNDLNEYLFVSTESAASESLLPSLIMVRSNYDESPTGTATITITTPETNIYQAASATLTIS